MLAIDNLSASVNDHKILDGLTLHVKAGEVHAIMGPNGSGKSTLAKVVAGHPAFAVTGGSVAVDGVDLLALEPEERAHQGVFIGWQYPIEVPGVNNAEFLRLAYNAKRKATAQPELSAKDFDRLLDERMAAVEVDVAFKDRQLNAGFSGGQKKRNEILQMVVLEPKLAILDETDSGLDVDALRAVARGINAFRSPTRAIVLITHYERLLELVEPDVVHVLSAGRIVASGGKELARRIETQGYDGLVGGDA
ncbi:MAG TPA: Fe-S cluster assembly ATPase SufC [Planctomycetota bacterium]|nr:Fe-S cluster assembly ATPase SufC [Planctomycetota bacterium]